MRRLRLSAYAVLAMFVGTASHASCIRLSGDQTIKLPGRPFASVSSSDNCQIFASLVQDRNAGSIAVLSNKNGKFELTRIVQTPMGSGGGLKLSHNGDLLAVAAKQAVILLDAHILANPDAARDPIVAVVPEGAFGALYPQFSKDDSILFVSEERNQSVVVINVANAVQGRTNKAIIGRVPVGQAPVGLALSPDGTKLFSTSQSLGGTGPCRPEQGAETPYAEGAVFVIDTALAIASPERSVIRIEKAGCNPVRVEISSSGQYLWVSARSDGRILAFDADLIARPLIRSALVKTLVVGSSPIGLAISPDGRRLWVANSGRYDYTAGSLTLVEPADPSKAKAVSEIKVGRFPRDISFMPDGNALVISQFGENEIFIKMAETDKTIR
ncbi:YncE family protein [Sphingomonas sp. AP4-R1]|uniref:YncE family protein n=1 Tax=Sphingomonas sp. AP4-R1 TaxID=2735134 RepID=UPI00149341FF|nr:YncE family protein [Sphingomonas sp. AP4-R1]QJU58889.1 YncE family protein [Sphingomonas sp. AP4-R1]